MTFFAWTVAQPRGNLSMALLGLDFVWARLESHLMWNLGSLDPLRFAMSDI